MARIGRIAVGLLFTLPILLALIVYLVCFVIAFVRGEDMETDKWETGLS